MSEHGPFVYRRAVRINAPGHIHFYSFSCYRRLPLLTNDIWREWLAESIDHARKKLDYALLAYVFMPEHVHLVVRPRREEYRISDFMGLVKSPMAQRVIKSLKQSSSPLLENLKIIDRDGEWHYCYWQPGGGYDSNLWTFKKIVEKADYCHRNPVKRRLVSSPELWKWSSFRWLEMGRRENEPLHVDDWDNL